MKPRFPGRRPALAAAIVVAAALVVAVGALAVSPKYWIHDTAEEFLRGEPEGVSIVSDGTLRLAPKAEILTERDEPYVWDLAVDRSSGAVYLGTGDEGWVIRVKGKNAEPFFRCAALEVTSVEVDAKGRVFAGTAPEGFVYRIDRDGTGELLFDAEELYVWDLELGPDGDLYAAVGPGGAVYRIDPESGDSERVFETDDNHVVCLAFDDAGNLLLGTEGRGLVIRVAPDGKAHVLHDCPQGEVGAVLAGGDGVVWAAAASTAESREATTTQPDSNADGTGLDFMFEITPSGAGDGVLYRIGAEGDAVRHWESGHGAVFDLARGPDATILAATGDEGAIYEIDEAGRATLLLAAEADQVVALAREKESLLYVTANPSRLVRLSSGFREKGTFRSEVLDARRLAKWGRIAWTGEKGGGKVSLAVRSGNTDEPDATWTDWSGEIDEPSDALASLGKVRFLQWRATLAGGGSKTPLVRQVRVSSLENNFAPIIRDVQVVPSGNRFYDDVPELRPRALYQSLPGGVKVQYSFDLGGDQELPPEARAPWTHGLRQVSWDAIDPNDDELVFVLSYRREDETRWKQFAEDVSGKNYTFNAKGMPDGEYRIRVEASDRRFNPTDERKASRYSEPFTVDNTAPGFRDVEHRRDGEQMRISGTLADDLSDIVRLEVSVNGDDWMDRPPTDGIFDSPRERFEVQVEAKPGEEHSVILRGTDLAGNLGTTRVLLRP